MNVVASFMFLQHAALCKYNLDENAYTSFSDFFSPILFTDLKKKKNRTFYELCLFSCVLLCRNFRSGAYNAGMCGKCLRVDVVVIPATIAGARVVRLRCAELLRGSRLAVGIESGEDVFDGKG